MRIAAVIAAVTLAAIAVLHVIWVFSPWPLANRADYARLVVGVPENKLPSGPLTALVAALIATAAYIITARAGLIPEIGPHWWYAVGCFVIAGVLLLRGVGGLFMSGVRPGAFAAFNALDLRVYSPLCLLLSGLSMWVATAAPPA